MTNKIGHVIIGLIFCTLFIGLSHFFWGWFDFFKWKTYVITIPIILIYCLLPDIDHESGTITWYMFAVGIICAIIGTFLNKLLLYFSLTLLVITFVSVKFTKHRGIIHSLTVGIIFSAPLYFIFSAEYAMLGFFAYYSHLVGDGYLLKLK